MKENKLGLITLFFVVIILISMCGIVNAQPPPIPSDYSGYVTVNGEPAPEGALVSAKIDDYTSNGVVVAENGRYEYLLVKPPDGTYIGKTIEFYVDPDAEGQIPAAMAEETDTFEQGTTHDPFDLTVIIPNTPPEVADIPDQTVSVGEPFASIPLDDYASDEESTDAELSWTHSGNVDISVTIDPSTHVATLTRPPDWSGWETITFTATDVGGLYDSDSATFRVLAPAELELSGLLISPTVTTVDEEVTITIDVTNVGEEEITYPLTLSINDGEETYTSPVTLAGGETKTEEFQVTEDTAGTYYVEIDGLKGAFIVTPTTIPTQSIMEESLPGGQTGYEIDAVAEADTTVTVDTIDEVTITVIKYPENPHPEAPMPSDALPKYSDIVVSDPSAVAWPIHVEVAYTDAEVAGIDESSMGLYYWKDGSWHLCTTTGVNTDDFDGYGGYVWADMTEEEASGSPVVPGQVDTTPPVISSVSSSEVAASSATITWTTDEPSTSQVEYGTTTAYGSVTALDPDLVTSHSTNLLGLTAATTYHYRVVSADEAANTARSGDRTFQTTAKSSPSSPILPPPSPPSANEPPVADAGADQTVQVNETVRFTGVGSYDSDGQIETYSWDFGDGTTADGMNTTHAYASPGIYIAILNVTDDGGASDAESCTVTVQSMPSPLEAGVVEEIPPDQTRYVVNASAEAEAMITLNTTGLVTVTVLRLEENPHPEAMPDAAVDKFVDVSVSDPDAVEWPVHAEIYYTDEEVEAIDESSLGIYYWKEGAWHRCGDTGVDAEGNVVWARMTRGELSGSTLLIGGSPPPRPAEFVFSDLSVTPAMAAVGEEVEISVKVTNVGDLQGSREVALEVNGAAEAAEEVTLAGGGSATVVFTISRGASGTYGVEVEGLTGTFEVLRPAEFKVSDLSISPVEIEEGGEVTITVEVSNIGGEEGSYRLELTLDGSVEDEETVTLAGGATTTVSFGVIKGAGSHVVDIESLTGSFKVTAPTKPPPQPFSSTYVLALGAVAIIVIALIARKYMG